jgi:Flp pilus assembly protein TadG
MLKGMMSRWRERLKKFKASERGVAAIEFALVAPPFLMFFGVIMETGLMLFTEYTMQSAVNDASRLVRTGQAQTAPLSAADFKTKVCATANLIIDCSGSVTVYVRSEATFAALQANLPNFITIGPSVGGIVGQPPCYKTGQPSQPAAVVATYDWYFNMWGMAAFGNIAGNSARRLVGFAIFQNEPFPGAGQATC